MAPEQFMGDTDYRSDIYAIGAVCYELLSYRQAFDGDSTFGVIGKIVLEKPPPLADVCPELDPAIVEIVNKALAKEPAQRYQDLAAMRADIKRVADRGHIAETPASALAVPARPPRPWWKWTAAAAAIAAVLLGVGWGARAWIDARERSASSSSSGSATRIRRSVAVLGFKNLSGRADSAWLSTALGEMLTSELGAGERLRTIPGETVARMKIELGLADADRPRSWKRGSCAYSGRSSRHVSRWVRSS